MAVYKYDLEDIFRKSLIGVSQRPLRDTFGRDSAEFNKVQQQAWQLTHGPVFQPSTSRLTK